MKKLNASYQPRNAMIGVRGHTCERSLADYEEGDETEQREITSIIRSPFCQQVENSRPGARFSKVPVTFRARNQIFKSKYKE